MSSAGTITPSCGGWIDPEECDVSHILWLRLRELASEAGIPLVGCVSPEALEAEAGRWREWVARGGHAGMDWMGRHGPVREHPAKWLPGCRSIVVFGFPYHPGPVAGDFRVARFAAGQDYHRVIRRVLEGLLEGLRELEPALAGRVAVDTAPLLEKALAVRAGMGWQGKNTCLIHPELGSYLFLGELLLDAPLPPTPASSGNCGDCRRCLDACPTGALREPGFLDARRCLAYLTVEHRGVIPAWFRGRLRGRGFGCDLCQEACPHNAARRTAVRPEFQPDPRLLSLRPAEVAAMSGRAFRRRYGFSSLTRATQAGLARNWIALLAERKGGRLPPEADEALRRFPLAAAQWTEFNQDSKTPPDEPPGRGDEPTA